MTGADRHERERHWHRRQLESAIESRPSRLGNALLAVPRVAAQAFQVPEAVRRVRSVPTAGALPVTIATIVDPFTASCLRHEATLLELHPLVWRRQLRQTHPDLVLIESAWEGTHGAWRHLLSNHLGRRSKVLTRLVDWCRRHDVPVVFWNKEDPVSYERFLPVARLADVVATTDSELLERYESDLGHDRVIALPFAASAAIHNPIGSRSSVEPCVCFAGTWFDDDRFPERSAWLEMLLDTAAERGELAIYERTPGSFPHRYRGWVRGSLDYDDLIDRYRRFSAFLNVNSVVDSRTMLARRVFEVLACGVPVISSPSDALEPLFGSTVMKPTDRESLHSCLDAVADSRRRARIGLEGWRTTRCGHTYRHRLTSVLGAVGHSFADEPASVGVVVAGMVGSAVYAQTVSPDRVVVLGDRDPPIKAVADACASIATDVVAVIDDRVAIPRHFLADASSALDLPEVAVVGLRASDPDDHEHAYDIVAIEEIDHGAIAGRAGDGGLAAVLSGRSGSGLVLDGAWVDGQAP